jgi:hypothetical protein
MMIGLVNLLAEEERRKDMIRRAEKQRLIRAVKAAQPRPTRFYDGLLAGLGCWLTGWGVRLQARYGAMVEIPSDC